MGDNIDINKILEKPEIVVTPRIERMRKKFKALKRKPQENKSKPKKAKQKQSYTYKDFYKLLDVDSHVQFENKLREIIFDKEQRESFYDGMLELEPDVSFDSFKPYFELYSAERKTNQQDYTPESIASLLSKITRAGKENGNGHFTAYDMTAGTGTLLINKWNDDRMQETPWSYAPHRYFYLAEELADNSIPYLIHNLAIRGMNAVVVHGDSLERKVKQVYFIQNSKDDFLAYSDVNVLPHNEDTMKLLDIREWTEEEVDHIESQEVIWNYALPMKQRKLEVSKSYPKRKRCTQKKSRVKLKEIAFVERAQKDKIYPEGSIVIQISATRGQLGLLKSDGLIEGTHYAVITLHFWAPLTAEYFFLYLQKNLPRYLHRVQEGLNIKMKDIENMPIPILERQ